MKSTVFVSLFILAMSAPAAGAVVPAKPSKPASPVSSPASQTKKPDTAKSVERPDYLKEDCYKHPDHDTADLCAQWKSATYAERAAGLIGWANGFAILNIVISAIGTGLVFIAFRTARHANQIALMGVRDAREIGEAQTAAYLSTERLSFGLTKRNEDPCRPSVTATWQNAGNSPAFEVTAKFRVVAHADEGVIFDDWLNANEERGLIRIDPGTKDHLGAGPYDKTFSPHIQALDSKQVWVEVICIGSYTDVFGRKVAIEEHYRSPKNNVRHEDGIKYWDFQMAKTKEVIDPHRFKLGGDLK